MPMQPLTITVTIERKGLWQHLIELPHSYRHWWAYLRRYGVPRWKALLGAFVASGYTITAGGRNAEP